MMEPSSESEDLPPSSPESDMSLSPAGSAIPSSFIAIASEDSRASSSRRSSSSSSSSLSDCLMTVSESTSSREMSAEIVTAEAMVVTVPSMRSTIGVGGGVRMSSREEISNNGGRCVGRQERVSWGTASVIGRRKEMEDAIAVVPRLLGRGCGHVGGCTAPGSRSSDQISGVHFFGVFDGHGGSEVAKFCAERMHHVIAEEWNGATVVSKKSSNDADEWRRKWRSIMLNGFARTDDEAAATTRDTVGSTAVVALLSACQIIVSNCGDSRAVLCRGTETIALTIDQKPDRKDELARIESLEGGKVINWYGARVLGVLSMSRAIGDRYFRPYIIPVPETTFTTRTEKDECLILASDGLWDVMSSEEVGEVARRLIRRRRRCVAAAAISSNVSDHQGICPAQFVADNLTQLATAKNSTDNISVIVVDLKTWRSKR